MEQFEEIEIIFEKNSVKPGKNPVKIGKLW